MTSNAGASQINKNYIGFDNKKYSSDAIKYELKNMFSPEFINRIDEVVIFNGLNKETSEMIVKKSISDLNYQLKSKNIKLTLTKKAYSYITNKGFSEEYGAREINRIIDKELKKLLVNELIFGKLNKGGNVTVDFLSGELKISKILSLK